MVSLVEALMAAMSGLFLGCIETARAAVHATK